MSINSMKITIMSGAEDGKVYNLDKNPVIIGRHPEDDVFLPYDNRVSRHHARLVKEGLTVYVEDIGSEGIGSHNGTFLGETGTKITGKNEVRSGQLIMLGSVWIKYEIGDG